MTETQPRQRLITHLRHVDLAVPDFDKQLDFYAGPWGLKTEHTDSGRALMDELYPKFNAIESKVVGRLSSRRRQDMTRSLRDIVTTIEETAVAQESA